MELVDGTVGAWPSTGAPVCSRFGALVRPWYQARIAGRNTTFYRDFRLLSGVKARKIPK